MKRKELEQVNYDFSDFSLSSPSRKSRRLDAAELAPIIEEEEPEIPTAGGSFGGNVGGGGGVLIEELPNGVDNEERALVVFNPINSPLMQSPSNYSISVSPQLISGLKNQVLWSNQFNQLRELHSEEGEQENNPGPRNDCLAVVPWVPSPLSSNIGNQAVPQTDVSDMMEAEEMEVSKMDLEDDTVGFEQKTEMNVNEGLHQWQQQHCMIPLPPQNVSTHIAWFR